MEDILSGVSDVVTKEELATILQDYKKKIDSDNDLLRRADLENQRKRLAIDKDNAVRSAKEKALEIVFDVVDIIDYAKRGDSSLVETLAPIKDKIITELAKKEIEIIQNEKLDSNVHEVISKIGESDSIIEVIKNGFVVDGKIARYPKVIIG